MLLNPNNSNGSNSQNGAEPVPEVEIDEILSAADLARKEPGSAGIISVLDKNQLSLGQLARKTHFLLEDETVSESTKARLLELAYKLHGALTPEKGGMVVPNVQINIVQSGENQGDVNLLNLLVPANT